MSKIVDFRQRIIDAIKTKFPEMDVDWYDGLFDEQDIADWTLKTPCARVTVMNAPSEHEATMEMNARLRCMVVIIDENKNASLDGDARAWEYVEGIAVLANLSVFGDPNAAPATMVKFRRISQPVLRREGVAVGVVEWESDLTIGRNRILERDFYYRPDDGTMITDLPTTSHLRGYVHNAAGLEDHEQPSDINLTED
jgi:hypothetical protein